MTVAEIDLRVGGTWRYVSVTPDGFEVAFHGEYREIEPYDRLVSTEAYEGIPNPDENATVNTMTLDEDNGRTTVTILVQCPSREVRDAMIDSGMEAGMQDALSTSWSRSRSRSASEPTHPTTGHRDDRWPVCVLEWPHARRHRGRRA